MMTTKEIDDAVRMLLLINSILLVKMLHYVNLAQNKVSGN